MIRDECYDDLICAISEDKHFFKEPIVLTNCGHAACKDCLLTISNPIKCQICGIVTDRDLKNDKESAASKRLLKICLSNLYSILERQMSLKLNKIKDHAKNEEETFGLHLKYIEEEIEIKIESLKIELDEILVRFRNQLKEIKLDSFKNRMEDGIKDNNKIELYENDLIDLRNCVKKNTNDDEERFYKFQNSLRSLNKILNDLNHMNYELEFKISNNKLQAESIIGKIVYKSHNTKFSLSDSIIREKLKNAKHRVIKLNVQPYDICILPNNYLLSANYNEQNLTLYNKDMELVKTIDEIDNKAFGPMGIALNNRNQLYICDYDNHCIIMTDLNFNKIKTFGSLGSDSNQFHRPYSILCKNENSYVCDYYNKRIQVLALDLDYKSSINLNYNPWKIAVSDKTLCVSSISDLYFYDLNNLQIIKGSYKYGGRINFINSYLYQFEKQSKTINCFNDDGALIENIDLKRVEGFIQGLDDGHIIFYEDSVFMSCYSACQLIKF